MSLVGKQNSNEVIAYQLRQSFKPGEVTAEEANQIGYQEAGLQPGDTVCIGMSGSFPGLGIASIAAANEMGLNVRVIASYGASMYGATRTALPIVRILDVARQAGLIEYDMLAVSPGGDFDQGYNLIYPNSREVIFALAREAGVELYPGELLAVGEEYSDNQCKSTNGGNPTPYDSFNDAYEIFLASVGI